jgi:diphthamide synthase subunit DPH2
MILCKYKEGVNILLNFVITLPLKTEKFQEDILNKKFEECRKVYNSCLGEILKRYNHMKESKEYKRVCKLKKGKDRNEEFNKINKLLSSMGV